MDYRESAFAQLVFMRGDETLSLQRWRRITRETVKAVKDMLRSYASYEFTLEEKDAPPLSSVYSLFAVLCILISEEFDAALAAIVDEDPAPFLRLCPAETTVDAIFSEALNITVLLRLEWENAMTKKRVKSVRVLTPYEMKICLQERGMLPHTLPAWKRDLHSFARHRLSVGNLLLSIDPLTPPDLAAKKVEAMLREYQAGYVSEIEKSWENEVKAGIVDADFAARDAKHEHLRFDFRRAFIGNKKVRGEGTTFEVWLRRLEVYDLARPGVESAEIIYQLRERYNNLDGVKISQDKVQARAYIDAALGGIPISAVDNVRSKRP